MRIGIGAREDRYVRRPHRHRAQNTTRTIIDPETAQRHVLTAEVAVCGCGATRRTEIDRGPWRERPAERTAP